MRFIVTFAASLLAYSAGWAATNGSSLEEEYQHVVTGWVLCTNQESAEALVAAREESPEKAQQLYAQFNTDKKCGRYETLTIIFMTPLKSGTTAQGYKAKVKFGTSWPIGYIVFNAF